MSSNSPSKKTSQTNTEPEKNAFSRFGNGSEQFLEFRRTPGDASASAILAFGRQPPTEVGPPDEPLGEEQQRAPPGEQQRRGQAEEGPGKSPRKNGQLRGEAASITAGPEKRAHRDYSLVRFRGRSLFTAHVLGARRRTRLAIAHHIRGCKNAAEYQPRFSVDRLPMIKGNGSLSRGARFSGDSPRPLCPETSPGQLYSGKNEARERYPCYDNGPCTRAHFMTHSQSVLFRWNHRFLGLVVKHRTRTIR